jgi:predicted small secreted protein
MKSILKTALFGAIALAALSSCNTTIGLGRDMRVLGTEMEKKAEQQTGDSGSEYQSGGAPIY